MVIFFKYNILIIPMRNYNFIKNLLEIIIINSVIFFMKEVGIGNVKRKFIIHLLFHECI